MRFDGCRGRWGSIEVAIAADCHLLWEKCRCGRTRAALLVATVLFLFAPSAVATDDAFLNDVLPSERAAVGAIVGDDLSTYRIDVALDPATNTLAGAAEISFRNPAPVPLAEIFFRLYPNAPYYGEGNLSVPAADIDGQAVVPELAADETVLRLPLPTPLAPGGEVTITFPFATTVPVDADGSYGIFQRDSDDGTWVLADWHPVLAVYEVAAGWVLDPATSFGDPTYAASAFYDVTLSAPRDLIVVASGVETERRSRGSSVVRRFVAGPAREFTLVADDDYQAFSSEAGETTITAYVEPETDPAAAEAALAVAARALDVYGARFGPYPFAELDLVQTPLVDALAVSWSGIVFLDDDGLLDRYRADDATGFETVVAHEVAHLWWGAIIGSNSNRHTFVNEGLATLSSLLYQEAVAGPDVAAAERQRWVIGPARSLLIRGDAVVDLPIAEGQDPSERAQAAYGKGTLGFLAIRAAIGDEAFFAALAAFATDYRFDIAELDDLLTAFETAAGDELDPLWVRWFEAAAMTEAEIAALE